MHSTETRHLQIILRHNGKKNFPPRVTAKRRWRLFNVFSITRFPTLALEVAVCPEEQVVNANPGSRMRWWEGYYERNEGMQITHSQWQARSLISYADESVITNASPLSKSTCQNGKLERRSERPIPQIWDPALKEHTHNSFRLTVEASEVSSVVFTVFSCWESPTSRVVFSPVWTLSYPWRVMVWRKTTLLVFPYEAGAVTHGAPHADHLVSICRLEKRSFPQLEKNKQWHSFQLILLYVQICFHCLSLTASLFSPLSINSWWNYYIIPWKLPMRAGVAASRRWLPDGAGLGCSWLLVLMWSDRASEAKETTEDRSTFQSFPRSYQVNRRLKTNQI